MQPKHSRPGRCTGDPYRRLLAAIFVRAARDTRSKDRQRADQAFDFLRTPEARELLTAELEISLPLALIRNRQMKLLKVEVTRCQN